MSDESDDALVARALAEAGLTPARHLHAVPSPTDDRLGWLEWRRGGLGASDIAAVLGLSPWASPWALWAQKVGKLDDVDQTEAMEFGTMAEDMLARYFEDRTGLWVDGTQTRCQHPSEPWARCTVDGFVFETAGRYTPGAADALGVVEFKTTADTVEQWEAAVPLHYACQATWTAIVTQQPVVWFGVLHLAFGRPRFRVYTFNPSPDDVALVMARARSFWFDHVVPQIDPPVDGSDATTAALIDAYHGDAELDAIEAGPALVTAVERIRANEQRVAECERIIDEQKNIIRHALGDHPILTHGCDAKGKPIVLATWKPSTRSTIDTKRLRAEQPDVADAFTTTTDVRTLRIKGVTK